MTVEQSVGPLTPHEVTVVNLLADAWIAFAQLEQYHPADAGEMQAAIHQAQHIVMARLAVRGHPDLFHRIPSPLPPEPPPAKPDLLYGALCGVCGRFYLEAWWHRLTRGHRP